MKIRVLGCSGAIAQQHLTTSFLIDQRVLIDAGTGVGSLTLDEMAQIDHVFLTHSHLDHVAALPLMLDAVSDRRRQPVFVHGLPATLQALQAHIFNQVIWPDFSRIPTPEQPWLRWMPLAAGATVQACGYQIQSLPATHTVPAVGYAVRQQQACWVFSGDTCLNLEFWSMVNGLAPSMLVMETAFSDEDESLAALSQHMSPRQLALGLNQLSRPRRFPIYISHAKPSALAQIQQELAALQPTPDPEVPTLELLHTGQILEI